ncbi:MAG: membrane protein insertase YidC [Planktomarina sp.]|nr:membrane protein insertase YidC [Planktomarina sp.]MDT2034275.1 membrane protein insertase YidC [Planktomarina sp.]MDT2040564.1 membrane protein insertase YidC [Planktomarina sp.]MDT2050480.1 membrane protein insertase YidC [Planktomarina sp.]|tara:strand:- start:333 stop:2114 length:1782 start_codon:yes stop_codon:yes gene_type:complete
MDDQNKNLLLATGLSFAVMLAWFAIAPPQGPPPTVEDASKTSPVAETNASNDVSTNIISGNAKAVADADRIKINTPRLEGSLSLLAGRIDDLRLKDYTETIEEGSPIVTLLSPEGSANAYYGLNGWAAASGVEPADVPGPNTLWSSSDKNLTPNSPVTLAWDNGKGLSFQRVISIDDNFMFSIKQSVTNQGNSTAALAPYGQVARHGEPPNLKGFFILHEGMVRMSDGELNETDYGKMPKFEINPKERAPAEVIQVANGGWIGFTDHYWMTTMVPQGAFKSVAKYDINNDVFLTEAVQPTQTVEPGATTTVTSQFFAGAKEWEVIRTYQDQGGVEGFVDSIDWGWFYFLTKPIFWLLHTLNGYIGNMGWSIICLTLVIKALLLPLAYKSYVSMARMKELQPEMEKLKESAGDDKQKMQKGMMELYKKNKVNPAAGCLPILPQIPIFFSLYKVIFVTLELRHATWFGPFNDLSAPDPTSIMNLFGLLPWGAPDTGSIIALVLIGILPLLLGISMWMQQKLNPAPTDPTQAMIFTWMPWVFMFMLGGFASGLVVYWIANNTITFIQQYSIMRSQGVKPEVFANIKDTFRKFKKGG